VQNRAGSEEVEQMGGGTCGAVEKVAFAQRINFKHFLSFKKTLL